MRDVVGLEMVNRDQDNTGFEVVPRLWINNVGKLPFYFNGLV